MALCENEILCLNLGIDISWQKSWSFVGRYHDKVCLVALGGESIELACHVDGGVPIHSFIGLAVIVFLFEESAYCVDTTCDFWQILLEAVWLEAVALDIRHVRIVLHDLRSPCLP